MNSSTGLLRIVINKAFRIPVAWRIAHLPDYHLTRVTRAKNQYPLATGFSESRIIESREESHASGE
jgi:hypothetical protein